MMKVQLKDELLQVKGQEASAVSCAECTPGSRRECHLKAPRPAALQASWECYSWERHCVQCRG